MFRFTHFNFNVLDLDRSLAFYRDALGLVPVREKEAANGALIPPSLDAYNASIANDEMPPIGFAP